MRVDSRPHAHLARLAATAALIVSLAACSTPVPSGSPSAAPEPSQTVRASLAPTVAPSAPQPTLLDPEDLPPASLEDEDATLICDPEASNIDPKAGESLIVCYDGLLLGLRALKTAVERVERLYLRRPICATIPCTPVELSTVTVTGWSGENPTSVDIDWEMFRITPPEPDPGARWPTPSSRESPPIARPEIVDAPEFVAQREPFPFCGHADEDSVAAMGCFRDAIIAGRPAEMLDRFDVTGGTEVFRFDGQGLAIRYALYDDGWFEDAGNLVLGSAHGWSFHNWVDREPIP